MSKTLKGAVRERLTWFQSFMHLYEKAAPLISAITSLQIMEDGEVPVSPQVLAECHLTFGLILQAAKRMPPPEQKELSSVKREFEAAIASCIKATDSIARYARFGRSNTSERIHLIGLMNSIVLANEYIESVARRLNPVA